MELHPDDARAVYLGAGASAELHEEEKALQWAIRALSMDPDDAALVYGMDCIFARLGSGAPRPDDIMPIGVAHGVVRC